jgi:putative hemolysin
MSGLSISILLLSSLLIASMLVTAVNYAMREYSRARLASRLSQARLAWFTENETDINLILSAARLLATMGLLPVLILAFREAHYDMVPSILLALGSGLVLLMVICVAVPYALAANYPELLITLAYRPMKFARIVFAPVLSLVHAIERGVSSAASTPAMAKSQSVSELREEILSVVDEGRRDGIVDPHKQRLIESALNFGSLTVEEAMTPHGKMRGLEVTAPLDEVRKLFEESGHSRLPVWEDGIDNIQGILYARDLLHIWGATNEEFTMRGMLRPHFQVPHTKALPDLLQEFRKKKVHIAIVQDEFGGTAGLITIEDILERIVGEISDEHEPIEPEKFVRIDSNTAEADAQIELDELNRLMGLHLPEDRDYSTLAGYLNTEMGRIPQAGTRFNGGEADFIVLDAQPQRVIRVRVVVKQAEQTPAF